MKNLILEELYIEITRNCNQNCQHCMRGTKQNINISNTVLEHIFMNPEFHIVKIDKLVLTGGEPFLNPEAIIQILNLLDQQKIKINILQIVTNGFIYIHSLMKKLEYFQKKKNTYILLILSFLHLINLIKKYQLKFMNYFVLLPFFMKEIQHVF